MYVIITGVRKSKIGVTRHFESIPPCNLADVKVSLQNLCARGWPAKTLTDPKLRSYVTYL